MKTYPLIILAGGEKGPLYETTGYAEKAIIPIHGDPMLSRVIREFKQADQVGDIVVVGSHRLDELPEMDSIRKRVPHGLNAVQSLVNAVTYVKHRLYQGASEHDGYLISFCDAVFLTKEIINHTLKTIFSQEDASVVLHYVEKASFVKDGLPTKRTWLPVGGMEYTGSTIYYLKSFTQVMGVMPTLLQLRSHRKEPEKMFELIGCKPEMSMEEISRALSNRLGIEIRIRISPHARLGMDVDKPSDLELANQLLAPEED